MVNQEGAVDAPCKGGSIFPCVSALGQKVNVHLLFLKINPISIHLVVVSFNSKGPFYS